MDVEKKVISKKALFTIFIASYALALLLFQALKIIFSYDPLFPFFKIWLVLACFIYVYIFRRIKKHYDSHVIDVLSITSIITAMLSLAFAALLQL